MADADGSQKQPGLIRRAWRALVSPSARWSVLSILVLGFVIGAGGVIATLMAMEATGTTEFCGGACHSMQAFSLPEYKQSAHSSNRSGVTAACGDCHIPHSYPKKIFYKAKAGIVDIIGEARGTIRTPEKFEQERARLANQVWKEFRETDSANCRHCHKVEAMNPEEQRPSAQRAHASLKAGSKTCIDCHQFIVHDEPKEPSEPAKAAAAR